MKRRSPSRDQPSRDSNEDLLSAEDVKMYFPLRGGVFHAARGSVRAVDGVTLGVRRGETLAVVGESGSGKSTLARVLLRLLEPSAGKVFFMGHDLTSEKLKVVREERKHLQMVFQDPMSSLNPRMTIKNIVGEPLLIHEAARDRPRAISAMALVAILAGILSIAIGLNLLTNPNVDYLGFPPLGTVSGIFGMLLVGFAAFEIGAGVGVWHQQTSAWGLLVVLATANLLMWVYLAGLIGAAISAVAITLLLVGRRQFRSEKELTERILKLLDLVGLKREHLSRFPHEFSGGQRQRINIARALALNPDMLILDEPTSALDVSVQAQILNLLMGLQRKLGLTYLFITHDLSVVFHIADRVAVMYAGKIVEIGNTEEIFGNPLHPYTKALISAAPVADPSVKAERIVLEGEVPSPTHPPPGCRFHPRCWLAFDPCSKIVPELFDGGNGHLFACFATARDRGLWMAPAEMTPAGRAVPS